MMEKKLQRVCAIVVNWDRKELTLECLKVLEKLEFGGIDFFVIVVDNGSSDGSVEAIRKLKFPTFGGAGKIKVIENGENLGYAGGNNVGIKEALRGRADYILIMNNDVVPRGDLLTGLVREMREHGDWGLVSPKIYFAKGFEFHEARYKKNELGKVIWYAGGEMDWENVLASHRGVDEVDEGQYDRRGETDFASGSCMMMKREMLEEVGMFDEKYFMYWEDVDLSRRAMKKGWKVVYSPVTCAWHKVSSSSAIGSNLNDYFITRNRLRFGMKYATLRSKMALIRESVRFVFSGREWQKRGVKDFCCGRWGRGRWG